MHPHTWPRDLIEAWRRRAFGVEDNWRLRCRPSSARCLTRSCGDLPRYRRSHLGLHLQHSQAAGGSMRNTGFLLQWRVARAPMWNVWHLRNNFNFSHPKKAPFITKIKKSLNVALENIVKRLSTVSVSSFMIEKMLVFFVITRMSQKFSSFAKLMIDVKIALSCSNDFVI